MQKRKNDLMIPIIIFFVGVLALIILFKNADDKIGVSNNPAGLTAGEITQDRTLGQSFLSPYDGMSSFSVLFATYGRENTSNVVVQLYDKTENDKLIYSNSLSAAELLDNTFVEFYLPETLDSENHIYEITVSCDGVRENGITIWGSSNDGYKDGELYVNGMPYNMDIAFKVSYDKDEYFGKINTVVLILLALVFLCLILVGRLGRVHKKLFDVIMYLMSAITLAIIMGILYSYYILGDYGLSAVFESDSIIRICLLMIPSFFIVCHVGIRHDVLYDFIFRKRWIIAVGIFIFLVSCKINMSSVSMFSYYIQPDIETSFSKPLIGKERPIRSDEWLVDTPTKISASYSNYEKYNDLIRGTKNFNIAATGLYKGYSALSNIFNFGYYLFGVEYGLSFYWCGLFIMAFMVSFELALILSKGNRLLALFGGCLIALSSYCLWWSVVPYIISVQGIIVCAYYYFEIQSYTKKLILALGVALAGAHYICRLYPAWQVPLAYILISFLIWIIVRNIEKIRKFNKYDWGIVSVAVIFMLSIVGAYFYDNSHYFGAVLQTVYPGSRFMVGGYSLDKLGYYFQSLLYPIKNIGNSSEASVFFSLFPLPVLLGLYVFIWQIIEKIRKKSSEIDLLNMIMLFPTLFLLIYCTFGFTDWLAKYSLMSYSMGERAVDFLGLLSVYYLIRLLGQDKKKYKLPLWIAAGATLVNILVCIDISERYFKGYIDIKYTAIVSIVVFGLGVILLGRGSELIEKIVIITTTVIVGISGLSILPLNRGAESLLQKPASEVVRQISNEDPSAKWIGYNNFITGQFVIANGGSCISSINYLPNMELWTALDPEGNYNEIYNRYHHVTINFTAEPTSFRLLQADSIEVRLSYEDIEKTEAKYIFSLEHIYEDSTAIDLELIYHQSNVYIYRIVYL